MSKSQEFTYQEKTVLINNLSVNYKIAGGPAFAEATVGKPAVLVLHGWGGNSTSWLEIQKLLVQRGYKVIVLDLPGFGKTPTPHDIWGVDDYSQFVLNFSRALQLNTFYLIGHSFGGRLSIRLTSTYPSLVKKLILCDSAGIKSQPGLKAMATIIVAEIGNALFSSRVTERLKDAARAFFYLFLRHKDYVKASATMKEIMKKVLVEDLLPDLKKITCETLIVWGAKDKIVPLKYAYIFKKEIKGAKLEVFPKIGHSPHLELPGKLAEVIANFLGK